MNNILYINPTSRIGGAERSLLQILSALNKEKYRPIVLLPSPGPLSKELSKLKIKVIFMPKFLIEAHSIIELPIALAWLFAIVKTYRISLIHSNSKFCCRLPILYSVIFDLKTVLHWRDFSMWADEYRYLNHYQKNLFLAAISRDIRYFLIDNGVAENKIKLIYDGADNSFYGVPSPQEKPITTIAITGRIDNWKGHEYLIDAMGMLKGMPLELLVFGEFHSVNDPEYLEKLKAKINSLGLNNRVKFIGFQKDPAAVLAQVDIVCVPSLFEPFGMVAVEAMAAGRPVIASNTGGLKDIIKNSVTGYLVEPKNAGAIAEKIKLLHEQPDLRKKMGSAGRARAQELFSIAEQIKKIEGVYNEIIGNNPDQ
ncbi:MAG: glycosyltransferase family 4 protein [Candidatus Margulisiibacteriota bacterium]